MAQIYDKVFWQQALTHPDWYVLVSADFKRIEERANLEKDLGPYHQAKQEIYKLVAAAVRQHRLPIASHGDDLDAERQPIDYVVLHHTKNPAGLTLTKLNTIQLLRIYGRYFANPTDKREQDLKGKPVWSGHFYSGRQVFWGYHWLIREDGCAQHILKDNYIGWHAGNWDINTRSIGICIDDDLTHAEPSPTVLDSVRRLIQTNYPSVSIDHIVGHCDVNPATDCPGSTFRTTWLPKLLRPL